MLILDFFNAKIKEKTCVTIGSFDGFHLAHKFIINLTIQTSKLLNSKSLIFVFIEHLYKNSDLILTKEENPLKQKLISELNLIKVKDE